ncbi:MAG: PAS domain S-box protein [Proteobacteria bacterium]|nr:PAS domain S-box protein [Pseudomonadota bacterium]
MPEEDTDIRARKFSLQGDEGLFLETDGLVFVLSMAGTIHFVNAMGCRVLGCDEDELVGKNWFEAVLSPGLERDYARAVFSEAAGSGTPPASRMEIPIFDGNGDTRIISWTNLFLTREGEGIVSAICHGEDITRQKEEEENLRKREERFRQVFMQADDVYMIMDRDDLKVLDVNPAVLGYGFTREEVLRGGVGVLMDRKGFRKFQEGLGREEGKDIVSIDRLSFVKKNGDPVFVSFRGQKVLLPESEAILGSFRDITDRILTEEEGKLMQAKLIQGNKMTTLGLMVSSVAHDINNPNNYIMFNSRIVSDFLADALPVLDRYCRDNKGATVGGFSAEEFSDIIPRLMEGISDGTKMITRIVNDLKDFVRQNIQIMDWDIDVNHIVKGARSLIENHIRKLTEKFTFDLSEDLPPVKGNKQQLIQVLVNLILNALESLPDKKHGITIMTSAVENGKFVEIKVADEGCGMPEEVRERALEAFFSTRLEKGGTGLGLTICNSIIREHDGLMMIDSVPGEGTVLTLRLPAVKVTRRKLS